jgi:hypothetical protein
MKNIRRVDVANSILNIKVQELITAIICIKPEDKKDFVVYDIDQFRAGRLVEKLDQCIRNIIDIKDELNFINSVIEHERKTGIDLSKRKGQFNDQYRYGIFTGIVNQKIRDNEDPI